MGHRPLDRWLAASGLSSATAPRERSRASRTRVGSVLHRRLTSITFGCPLNPPHEPAIVRSPVSLRVILVTVGVHSGSLTSDYVQTTATWRAPVSATAWPTRPAHDRRHRRRTYRGRAHPHRRDVALDGSRWALAEAPGASPRMNVAMVYDPRATASSTSAARGPTGTCSPTPGSGMAERGRSATTAPPVYASSRHGVRCHRHRVVLFGGVGDGGLLTDTWEWHGRWELRATTGPGS